MAKKHFRFFNMYLTTTLSISMVLFLVGFECVLGLSASQLIRHMKENVTITVVLSPDRTPEDSARIEKFLSIAPFTRDFTFISEQQALEEHVASLGDDPSQFLGFNPLLASYEVHVTEQYAHPDSMDYVVRTLSVYPFVSDIHYPRDAVELLNSQLGKYSIVILVLSAILLFISVALIMNTIRLHVYSKRFSINTMKLVGATPWVIKAPIVKRAVNISFLASLLALIAVAAVVYYAFLTFGFWPFALTLTNVAIIALVVVLSGVLITFFASVAAVNRYIRMKTDNLYYV